MEQAPSSSLPRAIGNSAWLACAPVVSARANDEPRTTPTPSWRAIDSRIIARRSLSSIDRHRIDDPDDGGINRRGFPAERFAGGAPLEHDQHLLVHTGANAVHREDGRSARRVVGRDRLDDEQLRPFELAVLLRRDERADHSADLHYPRSQ